MKPATGIGPRIGVAAISLLTFGLAACGDGGSSETAADSDAAEAVEAEQAETTTTTEATTTTSESTTTTVATTTTERRVPGKATANGPRIAGFDTAVGSEAPTITGYDYLTGEDVEWGGQGKPAAVLFAPLADWCPHCSEHVSQLIEFTADYEDPGSAQVLLVTSRESPSAQYPQDEWLTERGWSYPTVLENLDLSIPGAFAVTSVPVWFLVDSNGVVAELLDGHHVSPAQVFERIEALE